MPLQLNIDEESQPLTRKVSNIAFQQQGQLDWVSLSRGGISFSLGVLSRFSAASVDAYTVTVGHFIGSNFELSQAGRQNIERCLLNLRAFRGYGDVLWFGFGIKHLIRALSTTEQGATLVALCAALGETFPDDLSADILSNVAKNSANLKIMPALTEWRSLVRSCAGLFAASAFPLRVETLMRMQIDRITPTSQDGDHVDSSDIATALLGIGKVSCGTWTSIAINGPGEAGWLAALAEWLFGLTVTITDEAGNLKYTSQADGQLANVNIFYNTTANQSSNTRSLQVVNKSFELRTVTELFSTARMPDTRSRSEWISTCGRVEWRECLSATFGIYFDKLINMTSAFGDIFGSAAIIFEAIAEGEPNLPRIVLYDNHLYGEDSFGSGFIQNALRWLPELAKASPNIQKAYETTSSAEAFAKYQARIELLASCCVCAQCGSLDDKVDSGKRGSNKLCLVIIMETIIVLCRLLSTLEVASSLFPHLRGLSRLYYRQATRRREDRRGDGDNMGSFRHVVDHPRAFGQRLDDALLIFTARKIQEVAEEAHDECAVSASGVCVYSDSLREPSDDRRLISRIHVVPGQIECHERPYFCVEEWHTEYTGLIWDDERWVQIQDRAKMCSVKVAVRETIRSIAVHYVVLDELDQASGATLGPLQLATWASTRRGLVFCPEAHRTESAAAMATIPSELLDQLRDAGVKLRLLKAPLLGRCVALSGYELQSMGESEERMILREDQCLPCCIKAALRDDALEIIVLSK
jgi:hypothetical protein